jgi:hypothetical protein
MPQVNETITIQHVWIGGGNNSCADFVGWPGVGVSLTTQQLQITVGFGVAGLSLQKAHI